MTQQNKTDTEIVTANPPEIHSEVDIPFENSTTTTPQQNNDELSYTVSIDDEITKFKYITGRRVLFISMAAMGIATIAEAVFNIFDIESTLVANAFEVFKLIAMTVLGYIFGTKTK